MILFLAILLGLLFGFALNRAGATNPQNIINMLRLTDTSLMKAILLAIGLSSIGLYTGLSLGVIDAGHISIKTAYLGVIIGGAILGIGFAISGYCPGTGLGALATGRKDALFFVLGGFVGAFIYMVVHGWVAAKTNLLTPIAGGAVSLAQSGNDAYGAIFPSHIFGLPGETIGVVLGVIFVIIAWALPIYIRKER